MFGKSLDEIYRYLADKYLRPRTAVLSACEEFWRGHLQGAPFVAVHMRGSDKAREDQDLGATTEGYFPALASVDPAWRIFLLTDDQQLLDRIKTDYGDRVVSTDCQRTSTSTGVHHLASVDRVRAGLEVLADAHLALRADRFIGNGRSCVSAMIAVLKEWPAGHCTLFGLSQLVERNLSLYVSR
jgi:hypothetical protein